MFSNFNSFRGLHENELRILAFFLFPQIHHCLSDAHCQKIKYTKLKQVCQVAHEKKIQNYHIIVILNTFASLSAGSDFLSEAKKTI